MALKPKIELVTVVECSSRRQMPETSSVVVFRQQYDGEKIMVTYRPLSDMTKKEKMFAYLHGPLLDTLTNAMEHHGVASASKNDWYEAMKDRYAKVPWYNPLTKREETKTLDFSSSKTTSAELHNFINKIVLFLEQEVGVEAPDSDEYKTQKRLGSTKKSFNTFDNNEQL